MKNPAQFRLRGAEKTADHLLGGCGATEAEGDVVALVGLQAAHPYPAPRKSGAQYLEPNLPAAEIGVRIPGLGAGIP